MSGSCPVPLLPIGPAAFSDVKADLLARRIRRRHELANGVEERADGLVVSFQAALQFGQFAGEGLVGAQHPAQTYEGAHDRDINPSFLFGRIILAKITDLSVFQASRLV